MTEEARAKLVLRMLALGMLAGILMSSKLWGAGERLFPTVPAWEGFDRFPPAVGVLAFIALAGLFVAVFVFPNRRTILAAALLLLLVLCLQDQMRWQPWVWQYAVGMLVFAVLPRKPESAAWRALLAAQGLIVIAVYFWSGIHKLGAPFVRFYESTLMAPWLESGNAITHNALMALGRAVPYIEIAMAVLLLVPRTRRVGVVLAWGMHLFILVWLGPLGSSMNSVIWPWNTCMMILAGLLLWNAHPLPSLFSAKLSRPFRTVAMLVLALVLVAPVLSIFGKWDRYLAFHLYSGRQQRMVIGFHPAGIDRLGEAYTPYHSVSRNWEGMHEINARQWALDELNVPLVDEDRVLLRIAKHVCATGLTDQEAFFYRDFPMLVDERGWDQHRPSEIRSLRRFPPYRKPGK